MNTLDLSTRQLAADLSALRQQHPAWLLLAARRGPLILACLKGLLHIHIAGIPWEDALQQLAAMFSQFAHDEAVGVESDSPEDHLASARKELREWIARRLLVERDDLLLPTDALQQALQFADGLQARFMTSTASRLEAVQRSIEELEVRLNPDAARRMAHLEERIALLQTELAEVRQGKFQVLEGERATESVRDMYQLAMSLRADIRRVEDSFREADRTLRQRLVGEQQHRGQVLDHLLDNHDQLLATPEGHVFHAFHAQLSQVVPLESMKAGLRKILAQPAARQALPLHQQSDLRWLVTRLIRESRGVIEARARSERDVRAFLQTGLAAEHHRVGALLQQLMQVAQGVNWGSQAVRRTPATVPPLAAALAQGQYHLRPIDRLVYATEDGTAAPGLDLRTHAAGLDEMDESFWEALDSLDEAGLLASTQRLLKEHPQGLDLPALAHHLPPTHDLQTLGVWLAMALQAGEQVAPVDATDRLLLQARDGPWLRFEVPKVRLTQAVFEQE